MNIVLYTKWMKTELTIYTGYFLTVDMTEVVQCLTGFKHVRSQFMRWQTGSLKCNQGTFVWHLFETTAGFNNKRPTVSIILAANQWNHGILIYLALH